MAEKKLLTVVGATGAQGNGLVRAILSDKDSDFRVRALTRNPDSDKATELKKLGAEVVKADVNDIESLYNAFKDSYGVYCVTFYWEHLSPEKEKQHAKNMAEAAKQANVQHVIWSSLEDSRKFIPLDDDRMPTLMKDYKVPHFDSKAESEAFFRNLDLPLTILYTSFYWDNLINFGMGPQKTADDEYAITFPLGDKKLPGIAAEDIGKCAYGIFKKGNELINTTIGIAGQHLSGKEMAEELTKALGINVLYNNVPADVYRGFGFAGADDIGNMFQFNRDFAKEFRSKRDIEFSKSLNPELKTFSDWLAENKEKISV